MLFGSRAHGAQRIRLGCGHAGLACWRAACRARAQGAVWRGTELRAHRADARRGGRVPRGPRFLAARRSECRRARCRAAWREVLFHVSSPGPTGHRAIPDKLRPSSTTLPSTLRPHVSLRQRSHVCQVLWPSRSPLVRHQVRSRQERRNLALCDCKRDLPCPCVSKFQAIHGGEHIDPPRRRAHHESVVRVREVARGQSARGAPNSTNAPRTRCALASVGSTQMSKSFVART